MSKNIVVVGASAGAVLARSLAHHLPDSYRLILIERLDYAFHPTSSLRGAVREGKEADSFQDLDNFFSSTSRHVVLKGTEVSRIRASTLVLSKPFEASAELDFEYAVLALGTLYHPPARPVHPPKYTALIDPPSPSKDEALRAQQNIQQAIKSSGSILIIGGGPVGIEFAGEVRHAYKGKRITIVTSSSLLPGPWKESMRYKFAALLRENNVNVKTHTSIHQPEDLPINQHLSMIRNVTLSDGSTIQADFIFLATGGKPNTKLIADSGYPDLLDEKKRIKVNPLTLKIVKGELSDRIFVMGDASNAPGPKTYYTATEQVPVLVSQIMSGINRSRAFRTWKEPKHILVVPFGPWDGYAQLGPLVVGNWVTSAVKGRTLRLHDWRRLYKAWDVKKYVQG
ncbi:unnamed protein product [Sympodiomycopsis kandeliae]